MSECNFWWRAGEVQWCDMVGNDCHCGGWDDYCDMKSSGCHAKKVEAIDDIAATLTDTRKAKQKRMKGAA